ncbi:MAG: hypothetical protein AVDCRST_MAG75-1556, partial [uncultured Propionibacteriaceae bacterium]
VRTAGAAARSQRRATAHLTGRSTLAGRPAPRGRRSLRASV